MSFLERTYPQVDRAWLRYAAGMLWAAAGVMLLIRAEGWLVEDPASRAIPLALAGFAAALVIGRFKFRWIAERNLRRIERLDARVGLWAFQSAPTYLMIVGMMAFGLLLRHSGISHDVLALLYLGIGGGLVVASLHYFRR